MPEAPAPVRILCLAGSTRSGSFNRLLLSHAATRLVAMGTQPETFDLREHALPLYDGDLEASEGIPENAQRLAGLVLGADGILVASPEYNAGMTGALKNALDWCSRVRNDGSHVFAGKPAALIAASPGRLGGLRGLVHTRAVLTELGCYVVPAQAAVPSASQALSDSGEPTEAPVAAMLEQTLGQLVRVAVAFRD